MKFGDNQTFGAHTPSATYAHVIPDNKDHWNIRILSVKVGATQDAPLTQPTHPLVVGLKMLGAYQVRFSIEGLWHGSKKKMKGGFAFIYRMRGSEVGGSFWVSLHGSKIDGITMHQVARRKRWIRHVPITPWNSVVIRRLVHILLRQLMLTLGRE